MSPYVCVNLNLSSSFHCTTHAEWLNELLPMINGNVLHLVYSYRFAINICKALFLKEIYQQIACKPF